MKTKNDILNILGTILLVSLIPITYDITLDYFNTPKWTNFVSKEGRFKMEFPNKPTETTKFVITEYGQFPIHMVYYDATKDNSQNLNYVVSYVDYPDTIVNSFASDNISEIFKSTTKKAINTLHGKLEHEIIDSFKNYPGEEIKISFQDGKMIYREKNFLVRNRLYRLSIITNAKKDFNKSIDNYFDSFELQ